MSLHTWFPLLGNINQQGASGVSLTTSTATVDAAGKIGSCYYFSGSTYLAESTYDWSSFNTSQFSLCCWYKEPSIASGNSQIICIGTNSGWNNIRIGLLRRVTSGLPMFSVSDGTNAIQYNFTATSTRFAINTWNHIAVTYKNGTMCMYINGELDNTSTTSIVPALNSSQHLGIGAASNGAEKLLGYLNDVRIYDHALSAAEVKEIAQGLVLHYKFDDSIGFTDLISCGVTPSIYNNHSNTNMPSTLVNTGNYYNGDIVWRETCTPTANSLSSIQTALGSHGIYDWRQTFSANTKYVFWIYYKPISHADTRCGGTASNIGGWTEIPPVEVGDGWYRVGAYRNGTVTTDKTDNIFVSFKVPSATNGTPIIIDWASPHLVKGTTEIPPYDYPFSTIEDNGGYNHNGVLAGNLTTATNSARYSNSIYLPNGNTDFITTKDNVGYFTNGITLNIWFKSSNKTPGADYHHCFNSLTSWTYIEMAVHKNGYLRCGLYINGTRYVANTDNNNILDGNWHMLTMTYDGASVKRYVDGVLKGTQSASGNLNTASDKFVFGRGANTSYYCKEAQLSDARLYVTGLSAADVLTLYNVGARVDNQGAFHAYESNEGGANGITKTGILKDYASESIMQLKDGSYWKLMMFHYVDGGNNLFTSSNVLFNNGFGLYSRLRDIDNYTYGGKYEFYVLQDDIEYRWTQTNKPTAASIAGLTTVSGYTNPVNGLAKASQSNTYIGYGSWWGAVGCYTKYSTGGKTGIPGFGAHNANGICTRYMALYARIEKPVASLDNGDCYASQIIEM